MTSSMVLASGKAGTMPLHMFHPDHPRIHHA
jgi:hypothetical protein